MQSIQQSVNLILPILPSTMTTLREKLKALREKSGKHCRNTSRSLVPRPSHPSACCFSSQRLSLAVQATNRWCLEVVVENSWSLWAKTASTYTQLPYHCRYQRTIYIIAASSVDYKTKELPHIASNEVASMN